MKLRFTVSLVFLSQLLVSTEAFRARLTRVERSNTAVSYQGTIPATSNDITAALPVAPVYFQVQLNEFFKKPVPLVFRQSFSIFREDESTADVWRLDNEDIVSVLTAAPGFPGVPRSLWMVMAASIPTGLFWYGYYKFAVEEELLQLELEQGKEPRGWGGYGSLGPTTYALLLGPLAALLHWPGGWHWMTVGALFLLYTQFLLYDRVNDLLEEEGMSRPLQSWWCLPMFFPYNFIVGMRQVHFLSQYFYKKRGITCIPADPLVDFFPFIKAESFTWQEFLLKPRLWCSLFDDVQDIDRSTLPKPVQQLLAIGGTN